MPSHSYELHFALSAATNIRLHRTRLPFGTWEQAVDLILGHPSTSASSLQRIFHLGSYRTAWRMARIIREAMQAVEWPLLSGEVELCDVNLAPRGRATKSIWLAIERRRTGGGLIRGWRDSHNFQDDLRCIATALDPDAKVITSPSGLFRELKTLGFRQRSEPLGTNDALPAAAAVAIAFRRMLQARRHHGLATATLDLYLGEFVFRHNAAALGWEPAEQRRRVLAALRAPRLSA
jgi:hypothetical protein